MRKRKSDHLNLSMDLTDAEQVTNGDNLAAFNDKEIKTSSSVSKEDYKIVVSKKIHDVICIVNDGVKLPVKKDKYGLPLPFKIEDVVVYTNSEVNQMKGLSDGTLLVIHDIKNIFGGSVEINPPPPRKPPSLEDFDKPKNRWKSKNHLQVETKITKLPGGNNTDPTEDEVMEIYRRGLFDDVPVIDKDCVITERLDDDGWYR